jgi:serine/threonine protein kinase
MGDADRIPEKRFRVACSGEGEFLEKLAPVVARRGVFVASRKPERIGTLVRLRLELAGAGSAVSGQAIVDRHARGAKSGFYLRFLKLDPDSLQFDLSPRKETPHSAPAVTEKPWSEPASVEPITRALLPPRARERLRRARAEEQTRPHDYEPDELRGARDPQQWAGGLQRFDSFGNYQLLERLGAGGMAEVFLARASLGQGVEKLVALKMVLPEFGPDTRFASLFLNEARISATLQHPHLVHVFDFGEAAGRPFLAMEYIHGRSLAQLLVLWREAGAPPPIGFAVSVAIGLCRALEHVHEKRDLDGRPLGLVHRDVSPGNVLVSEQGEIKLVDFGVASAGAFSETSGLLVGKQGYVSPQQARGEEPSPAWDLYSLGVVLNELLTLALPGDGQTSPELRRRLRRVPKPLTLPSQRVPGIPALLDRAVLWATDPEPARRAPSARLLRELLEDVRKLVPPCEIGSLVQASFGEELAREQRAIEELIARSRRLAPPRRVTGTSPVLRPVRVLRRRILSSRLAVSLAGHRRLVALGAVAALALAAFAGIGLRAHAARERALTERLALADEQLRLGRLVVPKGDAALALLLEAQQEHGGDPRVDRRLKALADALETLGAEAERRGNLAEAAVHLQGALEADPRRAGVAGKLRQLEELVRQRSTRVGGR